MDLNILTTKMADIYGVDISEAPASAIIDQCVKKISEEYPKVLRSYVETIAGEERYEVEEDGLIKVSKVYYTRQNMTNETPLADFMSPSLPVSLSSQVTTICEQELANQINPIDAEIVDYNAFELIPAPLVDDVKVYFQYHAYRTLAEIPDIFEDVLVKLFFYYDRENQFRKTMKSNNGNTFAFDRRGNIQAQSGGESSEVATREKEFEGIVKDLRNVVMKMKR